MWRVLALSTMLLLAGCTDPEETTIDIWNSTQQDVGLDVRITASGAVLFDDMGTAPPNERQQVTTVEPGTQITVNATVGELSLHEEIKTSVSWWAVTTNIENDRITWSRGIN